MGHASYAKMRVGYIVSYPFLSRGAMVLKRRSNVMKVLHMQLNNMEIQFISIIGCVPCFEPLICRNVRTTHRDGRDKTQQGGLKLKETRIWIRCILIQNI